ncbi:unnamed protein product [Rhizophagus irregularis]|nr:unnamed protein product [Rhizophagus irregularis]
MKTRSNKQVILEKKLCDIILLLSTGISIVTRVKYLSIYFEYITLNEGGGKELFYYRAITKRPADFFLNADPWLFDSE